MIRVVVRETDIEGAEKTLKGNTVLFNGNSKGLLQGLLLEGML